MTLGKIAAGGIVAAAAWLTGNLGDAFWVLLALLALDLLVNWRDESAYLQRLTAFLIATAGSVYLQAGIGVQAVHLVILALVAWEAARLVEEISAAYTAWQRSAGHAGAPSPAVVAGALTTLEQKVEAIAARIPAAPEGTSAGPSGPGVGRA